MGDEYRRGKFGTLSARKREMDRSARGGNASEACFIAWMNDTGTLRLERIQFSPLESARCRHTHSCLDGFENINARPCLARLSFARHCHPVGLGRPDRLHHHQRTALFFGQHFIRPSAVGFCGTGLNLTDCLYSRDSATRWPGSYSFSRVAHRVANL